ncbi:MAG: tetratricopeptide repeat protein, partial [Thermoguttaceae bacterium]|nr:tetratricopeptide repeat protein [Thermoguttaceae bacterium]
MNRVDDAETLLNALEASSYGQDTPDAIAAYRALVSLARGQWDAAISSLTTLLKVRPTNNRAVAINYYNAGATSTGNQLAPHDFTEACGVLILSYASRYAAKKDPADEAAQAAVFAATSQYARALNDPALNLIVKMIDKRRREALTKPIDSATGNVSVATPPGSVAPPPNHFVNPTDPNASFPPRPGGSSYAPDVPGTPDSPADDSNGSNVGTASGDGANESTPLTPVAAREALAKATNFFVNQEYNRANVVLLETMTSSETFWQDCPAEAARVALLRANVLYALNKRSEAQLMCQELLSNAPHSPEAAVAAFYLGYAADALGRRDDAIKYLSLAANARTISPLADAALYYLATNEWERRDVERAQQNFYRLYRSYPRSAYWSHAVWALAKIEFDVKNDVVAEELVNEALAKKPDAAIVDYLLFLKGEIALRAKDYEKARVAFDMIIEQYPESVWRSKATNRLNAIPERFRNPSAPAAAPVAPAPSNRPTQTAPRRALQADDETPRRPVAPRPTAPNLPPNAFDDDRRPAPNRPSDDRRPANARPNDKSPERPGSNVSRYPNAPESSRRD